MKQSAFDYDAHAIRVTNENIKRVLYVKLHDNDYILLLIITKWYWFVLYIVSYW